LVSMGSGLQMLYSTPIAAFELLTAQYNIAAVYTNHDYEPYAQQRDRKVADYLATKNIVLHTFKDQVIFERNEVTKENGEPYTVYTPYSKKWKEKLNDFYLKSYPTERYFANFYKHSGTNPPSLADIGFLPAAAHILPP